MAANSLEIGLGNIPIAEEIYAKYLENPASVDPSWTAAFEALEADTSTLMPFDSIAAMPAFESLTEPVNQYARIDKESPADLRVYHLIEAYRTFGHLMANVNPIAVEPPIEPWELTLETLGFSSDELPLIFPTCGLLDEPSAPLQVIIDVLKTIYSGRIGVEYMGLGNPHLEEWIQRKIEDTRFQVDLSIQQKQMILRQLNRSELLESFIHTKYTGQKRFSLEGGETLIPMLEAVIETGNKLGMTDFFIGMAHRGRLNVLSNILNKSYRDLFSEFEDIDVPNSFEGSGDVKYHKGYTSEVVLPDGRKVLVTLSHNPSHLEAVDAVVEGQSRARQDLKGHESAKRNVIPILVHGDAAIAGQGMVYEVLQLSKLPGYSTGGTIHIVINNQVGFTASPQETRSTLYCTDIARTFGAPVFHVNAEDPEGCVYVTNLAVALRQQFQCDVFIDLNCYRKYGHNEGDEPAFTQPLEYLLIRKKRPIREIYRDQLIHEGIVERDIAEALEKEFTQGLNQALQLAKEPIKPDSNSLKEKPTPMAPVSVITKVSKELLQQVTERFCAIPEGLTIHPKLRHLLQERQAMVQDGEQAKPIDWGMAEMLAYATLLWNGNSVRLSGQDSCRGTFSHRHAIWMDQEVEKAYFPLRHLKEGQGRFDVFNSPLSEYGVLGFEYGYSVGAPETLVIWEAQFGDFCNGAQVLIDQFIATAEQKWGQTCSLALFLPHGYEGQGPEHSSGRMERFLALAGDDNMRIVNPSTPAQLFHLLRQQVMNPIRKPLIVFTPKGLLRLPASASPLVDFTDGSFRQIIDDPSPANHVQRLILCSGRIYYDILAQKAKIAENNLAVIRIEQLFPLNIAEIKKIIEKYPDSKECIWAQEEPSNMGAWDFIHPILRESLKIPLRYVGRPRSASPATGSHAMHKRQHTDIMDSIFKERS